MSSCDRAGRLSQRAGSRPGYPNIRLALAGPQVAGACGHSSPTGSMSPPWARSHGRRSGSCAATGGAYDLAAHARSRVRTGPATVRAAPLARFHRDVAATLVASEGMRRDLPARGFHNLRSGTVVSTRACSSPRWRSIPGSSARCTCTWAASRGRRTSRRLLPCPSPGPRSSSAATAPIERDWPRPYSRGIPAPRTGRVVRQRRCARVPLAYGYLRVGDARGAGMRHAGRRFSRNRDGRCRARRGDRRVGR